MACYATIVWDFYNYIKPYPIAHLDLKTPRNSHKPYNQKVDTNAFGVICWEIISRKQFCKGNNFLSEVANEIKNGYRPEIPDFAPPEYAQRISQCWPIPQMIIHQIFQELYTLQTLTTFNSDLKILLTSKSRKYQHRKYGP